MTTKRRPKAAYYRGVPLDEELLNAYPEIWEPLPDTGMQEKYYHDIMEAIRSWIGGRPDVFVSGNTGVYYEEGNRNAVFRPDCYIVFGEGAERLWDPYAYRIWDFGSPPAFVLEIGSPSTYRNDLGYKRDLYARLGIGEYWRYDPSGGDYYGEPLVGEYLEDGRYRRFELRPGPGGMVCAYSPTLRLEFCWTGERLELRDPLTGEVLINAIALREANRAAQAARRVAEDGQRRAEAAQRHAEAEVSRLQAELRQLRGE